MNNRGIIKNFFAQKRNRAIVIVVAACLLALIAGVIMDVILHANGSMGDGEFRHRMLFILNSLGAMCLVFGAELIFRVRFPLFSKSRQRCSRSRQPDSPPCTAFTI